MDSIEREILQAIWVALQVIKFFTNPFSKAKLPEPPLLRVGPRLQHDGLGWPTVAVEVAGLRIAGWPPRWLVIPQINPIVLHNAADRIAPIMRPADVVPLLPDQHMIAARIDAAAFFRIKNVAQTAANARCHARLIP